MGYFIGMIFRVTRSFIKSFCFKSTGRMFRVGTGASILGGKHITTKYDFYVGKNLRLEAVEKDEYQTFNPKIEFGEHFSAGDNCHIGAVDKIIIGDNVLLGSKVYITDHQHGDSSLESLEISPIKRPLVSKGPVIIEDNVWIGDGVVILDGVTVGRNSIIAANAVVNRDVPAYSVVGGVPAKVIKIAKK